MNKYTGVRDHTGLTVVKVNGKQLIQAYPEKIVAFDWHKGTPDGTRQLAYSILAEEFGNNVADHAWGHFRMMVIDKLPGWCFAISSEDISEWYSDYRQFVCEYDKWIRQSAGAAGQEVQHHAS